MEGATLRNVFRVRRIAGQKRMRSAFRGIALRNAGDRRLGLDILRGTQRYVWQPLFDDAVKIHHRHAVAHMLHHRQGTHLRYHESIGTLTPPAIYFGRGQTILLEGERIKYDTIKTRCLQHRGKAA